MQSTRVHFHGTYIIKKCVAFVSHVLKGTKAFVTLEYLDLGLFVPPTYMAKHMCCVKEIMEANGMLSKYLFLCVQVIWIVINKLTKLKKIQPNMKVKIEEN